MLGSPGGRSYIYYVNEKRYDDRKRKITRNND